MGAEAAPTHRSRAVRVSTRIFIVTALTALTAVVSPALAPVAGATADTRPATAYNSVPAPDQDAAGTLSAAAKPTAVSRVATPAGQVSDDPVAADDPVDSDTPDQIRDDTERILSGDEFSYKKGYVERFLEWLGERLGNRRVDAPSDGGGGGFLSGIIGTLLAWALLLVALAAVVFIIVRYVRFRRPKLAEVEDDGPRTVIEAARTVKEWNSEAERFEAAGEWKQAIRARYRMLVRELTDRGQLPDIVGSTTTELRESLADTTPRATDDFAAASTLFELPWYASEETGPDENAQIRRLTDEILAADR